MVEREDRVTCVAETHVDLKGKSWCGRNIQHEFRFVDVTHAAMNARAEGYLQTCPGCSKLIIETLKKGEA